MPRSAPRTTMSANATRMAKPSAHPPRWDSGFEFSGRDAGTAGGGGHFDHSDFFESLFGRQAAGAPGRGARRTQGPATGEDHHVRVRIDLLDSYRGGQRSISMRVPQPDASGRMVMQERQLDVNLPKDIRDGQHLRLTGQGEPGHSGGAAGRRVTSTSKSASRQTRTSVSTGAMSTSTCRWRPGKRRSAPALPCPHPTAACNSACLPAQRRAESCA